MWFVYIHIVWFSCWIGLGVEKYPFGLLTMIVSLEAIFLSTFVMISQNRADAKRQVVADQQWQTVKEEDAQNHELLDLSNQILELTKEVHAYTSSRSSGSNPFATMCGSPSAPARTDSGGLGVTHGDPGERRVANGANAESRKPASGTASHDRSPPVRPAVVAPPCRRV